MEHVTNLRNCLSDSFLFKTIENSQQKIKMIFEIHNVSRFFGKQTIKENLDKLQNYTLRLIAFSDALRMFMKGSNTYFKIN